jgi:hypothetical protein
MEILVKLLGVVCWRDMHFSLMLGSFVMTVSLFMTRSLSERFFVTEIDNKIEPSTTYATFGFA